MAHMEGVTNEDFEAFMANQMTRGPNLSNARETPPPLFPSLSPQPQVSSRASEAGQAPNPPQPDMLNVVNMLVQQMHKYLSKSIDKFSGEQDSNQAKLWLNQLETTALLHNWPDAFIFLTAKSNLEEDFVFSQNKTDMWKKMQECVQSLGQNVSVYFHSKVRLCRNIGLSFDETKEQIAIGLYSKELSNFIMSKGHNDEDGLYQDIVNYERINANTFDATFKKDNFKTSKISSSPQKQTGIRCFNCNEIGHSALKCNKPPRPKGSCYTCGLMTHQKKTVLRIQQILDQ
ncbi:hypothetical protein NQ317_019503 [Molorchus minor]|uniref:CCHC-type domain-containing protein n=1 Tax=Molorchus minor TaxID=1323400 RepID=A0ABQ9IPP5_9CUCU|nr:hypothetical protein NQ317_019503 [Molorchus minor]